jgi:Homing endonuclease associated repeat/HNH endonuclease
VRGCAASYDTPSQLKPDVRQHPSMFTLTPDNRDQPDEVLLEDLRIAARAAGGQLTRERYDSIGRFSSATVAKRFGGFGAALGAAGLQRARHHKVSGAEALDDLRRVAELLSSTTVSAKEYARHGRYSEKPFVRHFGGWVAALEAAGLKLSDSFHARVEDEDLLTNLETVWRTLGRQPRVDDMVQPLSRYSARTYKNRFGGWRRALEAFVRSASQVGPEGENERPLPASRAAASPEGPGRRAARGNGQSRSVSWRLRWKVMSRDSFRCRACGRSPATHLDLSLHVDHIVAFSKGGLTLLDNLQTLCEACNGGKGAA